MKNIAIIGSGGFGREVLELILSINKNEKSYNFLGFYDDNVENETIVNGYPVLGKLCDLEIYRDELDIVIAIGDPKVKSEIKNKLTNNKINYPNLIHPTAILGETDISLGIGNIICANTVLTCNIKIGSFVILNLGCTIGHDVVVGDYSSFMPTVNISGEVIISEKVYIGTGAKIINLLSIGESTVIGAGAVVSKSLPANCTAVGVPAKIIKKGN